MTDCESDTLKFGYEYFYAITPFGRQRSNRTSRCRLVSPGRQEDFSFELGEPRHNRRQSMELGGNCVHSNALRN